MVRIQLEMDKLYKMIQVTDKHVHSILSLKTLKSVFCYIHIHNLSNKRIQRGATAGLVIIIPFQFSESQRAFGNSQ